MARKRTKNIRDLQEEAAAAEALEAAGETTPSTKKKTAKKARKKRASTKKKKTTRSRKDKPPKRKRLIWGVFSGSLKEEARFPYDQRAAAEEKLEALRQKSKKLYFLQPIKEEIADAPADGEEE